MLPLELAEQSLPCARTARAICTAPLADLELPTFELLAEAIAATMGKRINAPLDLLRANMRLTYTMTVANVNLKQHCTEPKLLRVGTTTFMLSLLAK